MGLGGLWPGAHADPGPGRAVAPPSRSAGDGRRARGAVSGGRRLGHRPGPARQRAALAPLRSRADPHHPRGHPRRRRRQRRAELAPHLRAFGHAGARGAGRRGRLGDGAARPDGNPRGLRRAGPARSALAGADRALRPGGLRRRRSAGMAHRPDEPGRGLAVRRVGRDDGMARHGVSGGAWHRAPVRGSRIHGASGAEPGRHRASRRRRRTGGHGRAGPRRPRRDRAVLRDRLGDGRFLSGDPGAAHRPVRRLGRARPSLDPGDRDVAADRRGGVPRSRTRCR